MKGFRRVDADSDGVVTWEEMRRGFETEQHPAGGMVLARMMQECAGGPTLVPLGDGNNKTCSEEQMDSALLAWARTPGASGALLGLTPLDKDQFWQRLLLTPDEILPHPNFTPERCGPVNQDCQRYGPVCWGKEFLLAWAMRAVCVTHPCICKPSAETKRLAKLATETAVAAGTVYLSNTSDAALKPWAPACGSGWSSRVVLAEADVTWVDRGLIQKEEGSFSYTWQLDFKTYKRRLENDQATKRGNITAIVYKSSNHQLRRGAPGGKICMISWRSTYSAGDWVLNFEQNKTNFRYSPPGIPVRAPKGIEVSYATIRDKLKQAVEEECCSADFQAEKFLVTGHSRGGTLGLFNAIDMVNHWSCRGRDLTGDNMALVALAPSGGAIENVAVEAVFSCKNRSRCLAGSVAALATKNDWVGWIHESEWWKVFPVESTRLQCKGPPWDPVAKDIPKKTRIYRGRHGAGMAGRDVAWWCHGLHEYTARVDEHLVAEQGWGSTCGGECGDPNAALQCYMSVRYNGETCEDSRAAGVLQKTTPCAADRWNASMEHCACPRDNCWDMLSAQTCFN